ncbi:hypothetical protein ACWGCW_07230 [Streptomyces sp. NPDC054933]
MKLDSADDPGTNGNAQSDAINSVASVADDVKLANYDMKVSPDGLSKASSASDELGRSTSQARDKLTQAHDGLAKAADGFSFASTLGEVLKTWEARLDMIHRDCQDLSGLFKLTIDAHHDNDTAIQAKIEAMRKGL